MCIARNARIIVNFFFIFGVFESVNLMVSEKYLPNSTKSNHGIANWINFQLIYIFYFPYSQNNKFG